MRAPSIDEVWYYPIENDDAEINRYRAGELDFTEGVPFRQIAWLRENLPQDLRISPVPRQRTTSVSTTPGRRSGTT